MKKSLDNLVIKYSNKDYLFSDPIEYCYHYKKKEDKEIIGFISALFSYGNVNSIRSFLTKLFNLLGLSPYLFIKNNNIVVPNNLYYRFQTNQDLNLFLKALKNIINKYSSIEYLFGEENNSTQERILIFQNNFKNIICDSTNPSLSNGLSFLIGAGNKNSANKRYNMFLRWMVREEFPDLGIYSSFKKENLLYPLDTHIVKISKILGFTNRSTIDNKMSEEITNNFKKINPTDPLIYDFPLSRLGILKLCKTTYIEEICEKCELKKSCSIYARSL
jgi:uncharacterized protein (TIGR02757 family)